MSVQLSTPKHLRDADSDIDSWTPEVLRLKSFTGATRPQAKQHRYKLGPPEAITGRRKG